MWTPDKWIQAIGETIREYIKTRRFIKQPGTRTVIIKIPEVGVKYGVEYTPGKDDLVNWSHVGQPRCLVHHDFLIYERFPNRWECPLCKLQLMEKQDKAVRMEVKRRFIDENKIVGKKSTRDKNGKPMTEN